MKRQECIYKIANRVIRILLILIVSGICLQSMLSTSFLGYIIKEDGSRQQRTLNIPDSLLRHLLVFILCMAAFVLVKRLWQHMRMGKFWTAVREKCSVSTAIKLLCVLTGIAGCVWVLMTQLRPASDPAKVYDCAIQWREKNFSSFAEGGYLFRYPFQSGMVLFYYLMSFLIGTDNYLGLQFINVAALIVIYYLLAKLAGLYWKEDEKIQVFAYIALALWVPFFFYVTYLYGIMPGMACALAAVYMMFRYLDKRQYRYMLLAAVFIGIATVFKMNCLIYLIAIACFLVYDIIVTSERRNKLRSLLFIILMIISVKGLNQAVYSCVEHISGYEMPDGEVMVSWIVMGLSETPVGPGHYSGYIGDVFIKYHYDTEKITEASIADIQKILTRMIKHPHGDGIPFFAKKNAFQWNDPTFIGMVLTDGRTSAITLSDGVQSVINGRASVWLSVLLNVVQTQILLGALFCLIMRFKSKNLYELFGGVMFLGGYLFHFFWESSSSYTIPYFVILIPYAVKGWLDMVRKADGMLAQYQAGQLVIQKTEKTGRHVVTVVVCLGLFAAFSRTNLYANTFGLDDGEDAKNQFYHYNQEEEQEFANGYYLISPCLDKKLVLTERDGMIETVSASEKEEQRIAVSAEGAYAVFRFRGSEEVLAVLEGETDKPASYMDDSRNMYYDFTLDAEYRWMFMQAGENEYYIIMNGLTLAYDEKENSVFLEAFDGNDGQRWIVSACK
ncbi:MAG: glycosyltransferase family 39 protein [Clostridium sp.]|nr:glycosyltransferase family 39 protein [Clostridium sp.]